MAFSLVCLMTSALLVGRILIGLGTEIVPGLRSWLLTWLACWMFQGQV